MAEELAAHTEEINGLNTERNQRLQEVKMLTAENTKNLEIIKNEGAKGVKTAKDLQKALKKLLKYKVGYLNTGPN